MRKPNTIDANQFEFIIKQMSNSKIMRLKLIKRGIVPSQNAKKSDKMNVKMCMKIRFKPT